MLIHTRSKGLTGEADGFGTEDLRSPNDRDSATSGEAGKKIDVATEPGQVSKSVTEKVDLEANRNFVGTDVLGGTLPKSAYQRLLTSKFAVTD